MRRTQLTSNRADINDNTERTANAESLVKLKSLIAEQEALIKRQTEPTLMAFSALMLPAFAFLYRVGNAEYLLGEGVDYLKKTKKYVSYADYRANLGEYNKYCRSYVNDQSKEYFLNVSELINCFKHFAVNVLLKDTPNQQIKAEFSAEIANFLATFNKAHMPYMEEASRSALNVLSVLHATNQDTRLLISRFFESLVHLHIDVINYDASIFHRLRLLSPLVSPQLLTILDNESRHFNIGSSAIFLGASLFPIKMLAYLFPLALYRKLPRFIPLQKPSIKKSDIDSSQLTQKEVNEMIASVQISNMAIERNVKRFEFLVSAGMVTLAVCTNYNKSLQEGLWALAPSLFYSSKKIFWNIVKPAFDQCQNDRKFRQFEMCIADITAPYRNDDCEGELKSTLAESSVVVHFARYESLSARVVMEIVKNVLVCHGITKLAIVGVATLEISANFVINSALSERMKNAITRVIAQQLNLITLRHQIRELTAVLDIYPDEMPPQKNESGVRCEWIFDFEGAAEGLLDSLSEKIAQQFAGCEVKINNQCLSISGTSPVSPILFTKYKMELIEQKEKITCKTKCSMPQNNKSSTANVMQAANDAKSTQVQHRKVVSKKSGAPSGSSPSNVVPKTPKKRVIIDFDGEVYDSYADEKFSKIVPLRGSSLPPGKFFIEFAVDSKKCPRGYEKAKKVTREGRVSSVGQGIYFVSKPKTIKDENGHDVEAKVKIKLGSDVDGIGDLRFYGGAKTVGDKVLYRVTHWEKGHKNYNKR